MKIDYHLNRRTFLIGLFGTLIVSILFFWWSTKPSAIKERGIPMPQRMTNANEHKHSSPSEKIAVGHSQSQLAKFFSIEELSKQEEKIPWDWSKGMTNAEALDYASKRALEGDNRWARVIARMARPPYSNKDDWFQEGKFGRKFPPSISDNRLEWQKLAADRGDIHSQLDYWRTVSAIQSNHNGSQTVTSTEIAQLQANARRYIQIAADNGLADAYVVISNAYRDGRMGISQDPIKSSACLIVLARMYPTDEVKQLLEFSAKRLRAGELSQAEALANNPASCRLVS